MNNRTIRVLCVGICHNLVSAIKEIQNNIDHICLTFSDNREELEFVSENSTVIDFPKLRPRLLFGPWPQPILEKISPSSHDSYINKLNTSISKTKFDLMLINGEIEELELMIFYSMKYKIPVVWNILDNDRELDEAMLDQLPVSIKAVVISGRSSKKINLKTLVIYQFPTQNISAQHHALVNAYRSAIS